MRLGGRLVHIGSLGLLGCALRVVGFIWGRWVHIGARLGSMGDHWVSLGSSGVVGFTRVRPGGVSVYAESMVFTRVYPGGRWVHPVPFIRGRWVHSGATRGSLCSSMVVGFTRVHPGVFGFILGR